MRPIRPPPLPKCKSCRRSESVPSFTVDGNPYALKCSDCGKAWCTLCCEVAHFPATCSEYKTWLKRPAGTDIMSPVRLLRTRDLLNDFSDTQLKEDPTLGHASDELGRMVELSEFLPAINFSSPDIYIATASSQMKFSRMAQSLYSRFPVAWTSPDFWNLSTPRTRAAEAVRSLLVDLKTARGQVDVVLAPHQPNYAATSSVVQSIYPYDAATVAQSLLAQSMVLFSAYDYEIKLWRSLPTRG